MPTSFYAKQPLSLFTNTASASCYSAVCKLHSISYLLIIMPFDPREMDDAKDPLHIISGGTENLEGLVPVGQMYRSLLMRAISVMRQ